VKNKELSLMELLLIFKKRFLLIILSVLFCGAAAFAISEYLFTPMYTATASMYVYNTSRENDQITSFDITASQELVNTYIVVIKSDTVLDQVINTLNLSMTAEDIRKILKAGAIDDTEAFSIEISHRDPGTAQRIVNTLVDVAPKEIIRVIQAGGAEVIDFAKFPEEPSSPDLVLNTILGAVIGLLLSFGISAAVAVFDTKIHCEEDLRQSFKIAVLGYVPVLGD
jgi:capsular polysaccharide biosynthesis protein